jgi:hypothetical protein
VDEWFVHAATLTTAMNCARAVDAGCNDVAAYSVFRGTHSGSGGLMPPTRKTDRGRFRLYHAIRRRR